MTAFVWPRRVRGETVAAEARGSMRVMWRAEVPAARSLKVGRAVSERRGCEVVRMSTLDWTVRSQVRSVWSQEVEYATVLSVGEKIVAETGAVWPVRKDRGPRWGVFTDAASRRFLLRAEGPEEVCDGGMAGASDFLHDHTPIVLSVDADRTRFEGP